LIVSLRHEHRAPQGLTERRLRLEPVAGEEATPELHALRAFFERIDLPVCATDAGGRFLWTNTAFRELIAQGQPVRRGQPYYQLFPDWHLNLNAGQRLRTGYELDEQVFTVRVPAPQATKPAEAPVRPTPGSPRANQPVSRTADPFSASSATTRPLPHSPSPVAQVPLGGGTGFATKASETEFRLRIRPAGSGTHSPLVWVFERGADWQQIEEQAATAQKQLRLMVAQAPLGVCVTDEAGIFEYVNEAYCRIYGYEPHELIGQSFTRVVPPGTERQWQQIHDRFIAGAEETRGEFTVCHRDGHLITVLADSARAVLENGAVRKITYVQEITQRKEMEQRLAVSEQIQRQLFENAPIGICITDADGYFVDFNEGYCQMYGYTREELEGKHFTVVVPPGTEEHWRRVHDRFIAGQADTRGEFEVRHKSGRPMMVLADSARGNGPDGRPRKITFVVDITARKQAETSLKRSEEIQRHLFESAPIGICVTNSQGYFVDVNEGYCKLYGYSREELIGQHFTCVVAPERAEHWKQVHDRFIAGKEDTRGEFEVVTKDGRKLIVLADSARSTGIDGQPTKITFVVDITARKEAEKNLRVSEEIQRKLFENAPIGICITNSQGYFIDFNEGYCQLYGYRRDELEGQHFTKVVPPETVEHWKKVHDRFIAGQEDTRGEFSVQHKSGRRLTVLADSARGRDAQGNPTKITFVVDITERKEAEQQLRAAEEELRQNLEEMQATQEAMRMSQISLERSETRFRKLFDESPMGICVTDEKGIYESVNGAYAQMYGYAPEELIGKPFVLVVPEEVRAKWQLAHDRFIAGQEDVQGEFEVMHRSGRRMMVLADSSRITGSDGKPRKVTYVIDITDRKEFEQQLRSAEEELRQNLEEMEATQEQMRASQAELMKSETRFRQLVDQAPMGICVTDERGCFESVNPTYCQIYGYQPDELLGKPFTMVVPPDQVRHWQTLHEQFIAGQAETHGEFNVVHKSGRQLQIFASSTRITGADGRTRKITYVIDITDRKRTEQQLRLAEQELREARFRQLIEEAPVGIAVIREDGHFESVNQTYADIFGFAVEELPGQSFTVVFPPDKTAWWMQQHQRFLEGAPEVGEFIARHRTGRQLTILSNALKMDWPDGMARKVVFVTDITARKRTEQLLKRSEESLSSLIEKSPIGICILNADGLFESANEAFCQTFGYSLDDLLAQSFTLLSSNAKRNSWQQLIERFAAEEIEIQGEHTLQNRKGKPLTILLEGVRIAGTDGAIKLVFFAIDITARKQTERELKRSEEQVASLVETAPVGIALVNEEGIILSANRTFNRMLDLEEDTDRNLSFAALIPRDKQSQWNERLSKFFTDGQPLRGEMMLQTRKKREITVLTDATGIVGIDGSPQMVCFVIDISERREAERELERLSIVASKTDNAIAICNPEGHVEWINEAYSRLTGIGGEKALGQPLLYQSVEASAFDKLKTQISKSTAWVQELQGHRPDGSTYWMLLNLTPVFNAQGQAEQFIAVLSDLTRTKELDEEIKRETQRRLDEAKGELAAAQNQLIISEKMAALGQLISGVAHEVNTPISAVKASIRNLYSTLPETLSNLPALVAKVPKQHQPLFRELMEYALNTAGQLTTVEERQYRMQITDQLIEAGVDEDSAEDLASSLVEVGVVQDIDKFLPLLSGRSALEVIDMIYKLGQLKVSMQNIDVASDKTSKIVMALKNYSYVQSSDRLVDTDLRESVDTVLTLYHNQLKYGVKVHKHYGEVPKIPLYPDEIGQVWTNIIHNAIQAMATVDRESELTIKIEREGEWAAVTITDNGPGIPDEIKARIFDPFFTTKSQGEGTGLGLDISRKIIEKHRGRIDVESRPGCTSFIVRLPLQAQ
jgi:PAS domain S-box-containing protein